jgi:hypothetical protein
MIMSGKKKLPAVIGRALTAMQEHSDALEALARKQGVDRKFTLDGRLIGDVGELIASMTLSITLTKKQKTGYDGTDGQNQQVEIKTTQASSFAFRKVAKRVICIKLHGTTHYEVVYDGPGQKLIPFFTAAAFPGSKRPRIKKDPVSLVGQRQLTITKLQELS